MATMNGTRVDVSAPDADHDELARARLAAIVTSSADAIVGETLDGIITDWNPAAARLYGYSAAEAIGQHLAILAPPERAHEIDAVLARVRGGESVAALETTRRTKDGRRIEVSLTISPVRNDAGQIIAASGIGRDITARRASERALAASEARFRAAFADAPIGMVLTGPDGRALQVNRAICDLLGYTERELLAQGFLAITHPDDVATSRAHMARKVAGELDAYALEKRYRRKDGESVWALLSTSLVRDEVGAPRYFVSQIQDITSRKEAEAERAATHQRTRQVLERISDGFYALDREWRFTYLNDEAERLLGRTRGVLLGKNVWQAFPPAVETPLYAACQQAMAEGITTSVEFYYPPFDAWFEVRAYPSPDGLSAFFRDVTARQRGDEALRAALDAAQAGNLAKSQFLALMSHELRTPLQAVLGYADLLLAGGAGSLTREQVADVRSIQEGGRRLITLVDQMFDFSRLEAGRLELAVEPVDLATIIAQVRQDVAPQAAAKGLELRIDLPPRLPPILADPLRLHQILLNLVGNAVKFTEQGWVRIRARSTAEGVDVAVQDTGIGIAADALPHIFEAFRQADGGTTRRYGGAGLGLAIARKLTEHQGGSLSVTSRPQAGSTFTVHFPVSRTTPAPPANG